MNPIESELAELNMLCEKYDSLHEDTKHKTRIRQIFTEFVRQGYNIVTPRFDPDSHEYGALSENGKMICERLIHIRKKKLEAIDHENFEFAADLRELEQSLKKRMVSDFSKAISNRFFVLLTEDSKEIIYNDFDGKLKEYFKIT
jgi:hypothetical protein